MFSENAHTNLPHNPNNIRYFTMAQNIDFKKVIEFDKKIITEQFFCFDGRMSKKDYWTFWVSVLVIGWIPLVGQIASIICILPMLGATARRLHDLGKTGWLQLLSLICCIGPFIVLFMCLPDGQKEANQYGEPVADYDAAASAE